VALGHWDLSLSQAIAAEITNAHWAGTPETERHDRTERHGQPHSEQQQQGMPGLLGACSTMDTIEKVALTRLLLETGGEDALHSHLADPRLCGSCFGLQQNLMACPRGCLRKLCPACFRKEDAGTNRHTCDQTHPATWRAAIRVMKGNTEIVTQWQKASNDADMLTEQVYGGPRQAVQTAEQQIQPQSHESKIATRGRNIKSRRLFPHLFPTGSQMAVFSWRTRSTAPL